MTITVNVKMLRQHRLAVLTEGAEVQSRSTLDPPDAGVLTGVTAPGLGQVGARADRVAAAATAPPTPQDPS